MKRTVVVGLGNSMRKDDGLGIAFVKRMIKDGEIDNNKVEFMVCDGPFSSMVGKVLTAERIIVIDAVDMKKNAGEVGVFEKRQIKNTGPGTHKAGLNMFAGMVDAEFYLIGVQPKTLEFGEGLSKECMEAYPRVVKLVKKLVNMS